MSTDILQFFTEQWNINGRPVQLYSSDKKSIYKACNNGGNTLFIKIFLIDSTDIQKKNRLFSETDLMRSLSSKGYPTCKPVASKNNKFIETFQYGKNIFLCMLLSEVPGETIDINNKTAANKEFFRKLGIAVGKLHSLTKKLIHDDFLFPDYEKEFYFKYNECIS